MTIEQKHEAAAKQSREVAKLVAWKIMFEEHLGCVPIEAEADPESVKLADKLYAELMPKTYVLPRKRKAGR